MRNDEFEILYKKYSAELYIYALSLCKDHHLSQDLVSETFFKALLSIEDTQIYIKYWLFRVCKNLYLDYLRKNKCLEDIEKNVKKLLVEDNTLDKIILSEDRRRVYYEVLNLQTSYKEVITLYYYCNLTLQEISQIVGISQGAARTLLFRARRKLKVVLEEELK
ncbi:sigma-70 family RNA polymerase sigma factor [Clostridium sp. CS001]|uniref:RNA polymerase sigma factor n=1 Tax=Clostridium sp. CS001 TaxID=2880648 RepID=UPI001CF2F685|nr:sigma-70 family RNA polymerase sigma factor [Clostridium sp. CS001]MCB2291351.1 sigma-70 family RNA polymerase sigma factor [Clostridium sp. CS001]